MDGAEVRVLEEGDHVGLGCLLEGQDCLGLEADLLLELSCNLLDKSLEGEFLDEQLG